MGIKNIFNKSLRALLCSSFILGSSCSLQGKLHNKGKNNSIYMEEYCDTLVLYDTKEIYEFMSPKFREILDSGLNYSALHLSVIHFRERKKTYSSGLYDPSYKKITQAIYLPPHGVKEERRCNSHIRTLYHELGHVINDKMTRENERMWGQAYSLLNNHNLLSSNNYASYTIQSGVMVFDGMSVEAFADEYAIYKTCSKDQPESLKNFFKDVDKSLKIPCGHHINDGDMPKFPLKELREEIPRILVKRYPRLRLSDFEGYYLNYDTRFFNSQCDDGEDNDLDGRIDMGDFDCTSVEDNNEARSPEYCLLLSGIKYCTSVEDNNEAK